MRKWIFIHKDFLIDLRNSQKSVSAEYINNITINTLSLSALPAGSIAKTPISNEKYHLLENHDIISAHRLLKKKLCGKSEQNKENKNCAISEKANKCFKASAGFTKAKH